MEHQLWSMAVAEINRRAPRPKARCKFSDADIVRVFYWAVLHDRPTLWACQKVNWPIHQRRKPLPSPTTMSRRLRRPAVRALLDAVDRVVLQPAGRPPLLWIVDGKPLPIGGASTDRQAGYGRAARCKAKGYKLHAIIGSDGSVLTWRVAPMHTDERVMARRMLRQAQAQGYLLGDGHFDDNKLHDICVAKDNLQLVTPRRYGFDKGLGRHRHSPGRLRSIALLTNPVSRFGWELLGERDRIERYYGNLTSFGAGLTHLPPWVRTHRRVRAWVQAKLVLNALRMRHRQRSYVA